jgi:NitT/TauT family transport system permease protein
VTDRDAVSEFARPTFTSTSTPTREGLSSEELAYIRGARQRTRRDTVVVRIVQVGILVALIALWEWGAQSGRINTFLYASPSIIWGHFIDKIQTTLLADAGVTLEETLIGFLLGNLIGIAVGLSLWYSRLTARIVSPYILALGSTPILALAPLVIIWFGVGFTSKVALATLACVVVALLQAYEGAMSVDNDLINLMRSFGATKGQIFRKIVMPSSYAWVVSALKLNIGFALIGAVIGEYISSEKGLGHMILVAGANFNIPVVLLGVFSLIVLALVMNVVVGKVEDYLLRWKRESI